MPIPSAKSGHGSPLDVPAPGGFLRLLSGHSAGLLAITFVVKVPSLRNVAHGTTKSIAKEML